MALNDALRIEVLSGHASPWTGEFTKDEVLVGRGQDCDVRLHPTKDILCASRVHLRFQRRGGQVEVVSEHSNGVTVERKGHAPAFLGQGERTTLSPDFEVVIGSNGPRLSLHAVGEVLPGTYQEKGSKGRGPARPVARVSGDVVRAAHSGRRLGLLGLGLLAAAVIAGGWWGWNIQAANKALRAQRDAELDRLVKEQDTLRVAIARPQPSKSLQLALESAQRSVVHVGVQKEGGPPEWAGTAWTAAPNQLVTNAHVAQRLEAGRRAGGRIIGHVGGIAKDAVSIGSIQVHPAFDQWTHVLSQQSIKTGSGEAAANLIAMGDIAVLLVERGEVGPPLDMAAGEAPGAAGDVIGYVGFPTEGVAGLPTPQTISGALTAVTDPFFGRGAGLEKLLLHMNIFAAGGASGSPIIDEHGKVIGVLSAASVVVVGQGNDAQRITVGINYAQSIVLVKELLEGRAAAAQAARDEVWRERIGKVFVSPEERLTIRADQLGDDLKAKLESVEDEEVRLTGAETLARRTARLEPGFHYFFLAAAKDWSELTLAIGQDGTAEAWPSDQGVVTAALKRADSPRAVEVVLKAAHARTSEPVVRFRVLRVRA